MTRPDDHDTTSHDGWRHFRWFDPHPATPAVGSVHETRRGTTEAVCEACGEAIGLTVASDGPDTTRLRELLAEASPRPWEEIYGAVAWVDTIADPSDPSGQTPMQDPVKVADAGAADRALIVALVNNAPALLDAADALRILVELKDGPRDDHYRQSKNPAWQTARDALAALTTPSKDQP